MGEPASGYLLEEEQINLNKVDLMRLKTRK